MSCVWETGPILADRRLLQTQERDRMGDKSPHATDASRP